MLASQKSHYKKNELVKGAKVKKTKFFPFLRPQHCSIAFPTLFLNYTMQPARKQKFLPFQNDTNLYWRLKPVSILVKEGSKRGPSIVPKDIIG